MERYLLLANICFDWSCCFPDNKKITNILLGVDSFNSREEALEYAFELLEEYAKDNNEVVINQSLHYVRKV